VNYPKWQYFPSYAQAPIWVSDFIKVVSIHGNEVDSRMVENLTSDRVLSYIADDLASLGYQVETGKKAIQKIRRPVLFGEEGVEKVSYEIDAFHDSLGIAVEVEAGRGARGNAVYRDLIRTSLIVGARYLVLGVMIEYRHQSSGKEVTVRSYEDARSLIEAIFSSGRLGLPFEGILLVGY
jgi:hypothetical protein